MPPLAWNDASAIPLDLHGPTATFQSFDLVEGPEIPLMSHLTQRLCRQPDLPALDDGVRQLSRGELFVEILALAAVVAERAPVGAAVGVRLREGGSALIAWFACLAAGCPAVLLDPQDGAERFAQIAAASRLAAVIEDESAAGRNTIAPTGHPASPFSPRLVDPGAPAFVVWTSGSTGRPKGIVHSQRSVLFRAGLLVNSGHLGPNDRYLSLNTISSMGGLLNAVATVLAGACLHRVDLARDGLNGALDRIEKSRVTAMIGTPALYRALCRLDGAAGQLSSLRLVSSNGDALMSADLALLRGVLPSKCAIQMVYGATETQAAMRFVPESESLSEPQVAAGHPIPGVQWALVDEAGEQASSGELGALWIRSRYTAVGEWEEGSCVAGRLEPDGDAGFRRYAMGDLVRLRSDGVFVVAGRIDRQIKLDGYRVEPAEIEAALRSQPEVLDAAVFPVVRSGVVRMAAFVAVGPSAPPGLDGRLREALAARLPSTMRPQRVHVLEALPMLPGNKIDTAALNRIYAERIRR